MKVLKRIWQSSLSRKLCRQILAQGKLFYRRSFLRQAILFTDKHIINSRLVQYFLNPAYLTNAWYQSVLYQKGTLGLYKLSARIPKSSLPWNSLCVSAFLAAVLFLPHTLHGSTLLLCLFLLPTVYFISHHAQTQTGIDFLLLSTLLLVFQFLLVLALPPKTSEPLSFLLLGIAFFFLVSFAVRTPEDFEKNLWCIYCILLILCTAGFLQQNLLKETAHATLQNGVALGEIIVLLFPFAALAPLSHTSPTRQLFYLIPLLMLTFTAVTATQSRAAFIGFSAELLLLILLINWRCLPLLLVLAPTITNTAVANISAMWAPSGNANGSLFSLIATFQEFWRNGFGVNQSALLNFYQGTALNTEVGPYLSGTGSLYVRILLELGLLALFGFLIYLLRIAHNTLTSAFTAEKGLRKHFAAGFAMLIGISLSSLVESTFFSPQTLLTYWGMLGMLRSARVLRYVDENPTL